jgi:hypothetical protein
LYENIQLRRIFGAKRKEVFGGGGKIRGVTRIFM